MKSLLRILGGTAFVVAVLFSASNFAAEKITYYHWDATGSPVAATDEQGNVVWRKSYKPYGEETQTPPTPAESRSFTGHVLDTDTGLLYAGARYYDPTIGRFMAVDPANFVETNPHSFNRYAYGNNNPYKYVDPDGRAAETVLDVISLGLSVNEYRQNPSFWNGVGVAVDALGTAIPFVPAGVGTIRQIGKGADKLSDSVRTNKVEPIKDASGPHTTWKSDPQTGEITRHETWTPNSRNPSGWDSKQSTDITGKSHTNKQTGERIPTPHTQGKDIPGGVRPADPSEIPRGR